MADTTVSIIVPYYNNSSTLVNALASIANQSFRDWECLVIDDGSDKSPSEIVQALGDKRFRLITLNKNFGRGYARQQGLNQAKGKYLAMVDADDWIYPNKLEKQVLILEEETEIALVSTAMAILDKDNNLAGVRYYSSNGSSKITKYNRLPFPQFLNIPHGPCMIRASIAKKYGYDINLRNTEDFDFLLRIILEYPYAVLNEVLYCYTEFSTIDKRKILKSYSVRKKVLLKHFSKFPLSVCFYVLVCFIKESLYRLFLLFGSTEVIIKNRTQKPNSVELSIFSEAWAKVLAFKK